MSSWSDSYLEYTKHRHKLAAMRHWPAQLYLFFITLIFLIIERMLSIPQIVKQGGENIYIIILSIIAVIQTILIIKYAFSRKVANDFVCVAAFILSICGCIICYRAYWNSNITKADIWIHIALMMAAASVATYTFGNSIHLGSVWRFIKQSITIVTYLLAIWGMMAVLSSGNIYTLCHDRWDRFWIFFLKSIGAGKIPDMSNWLSMGLTLLTGCLIVLSWSPNIAHAEWNPYPSYRLESPQRRALVAFGFLIIVVFSILAKLDRVTLLGFLLLLATDITIMFYCYLMQTDEHICVLLAEYILYSEPKNLFLSTPSKVYHKMARVSQHIIESNKLNMIHEKGNKMIRVLDKVFDMSKTIRERGNEEAKADWAFALGLACMPDGRPNGCSAEELKTYYYDLFDHVYRQMITPEQGVDYKICKNILYGMLIGAVKLCAKDQEWRDLFGFPDRGSHYQHCLCLICPSSDMKIYYVLMTKAIMTDQKMDDVTQRRGLTNTDLAIDRKNEIISMFYQV